MLRSLMDRGIVRIEDRVLKMSKASLFDDDDSNRSLNSNNSSIPTRIERIVLSRIDRLSVIQLAILRYHNNYQYMYIY